MTFSGLLVMDKPLGMTSHDVIARIRRKLGIRRVGHAGTLDPDASGLLLICVGEATRLLEYMTSERKTYSGKIVFGATTDTDDATGRILFEQSVAGLTDEQVQRGVQSFIGHIEQQVPRYSAIHIDGQRAYALARQGVDFVPPTRKIAVYSFSVGKLSLLDSKAIASFQICCSKGTYIRSICRDLGTAIGVYAHMGSLRREASCGIQVQDAVSLQTFEQADDASIYLHNPLIALRDIPVLHVSDAHLVKLSNGLSVTVQEKIPLGTIFILYQTRIAIVAESTAATEEGFLLKPRKVFWKRGTTNACD